MANPRRSNYLNRQNAVWLMNAASMVVAMGAVVSPYKAKAVSWTWVGGGVDNNVNTTSNWNLPYNDGSSISASTQNTQLFDTTGTARPTVSIGSNRYFGAVTFGAMAGTTGYTFTSLSASPLMLSIAGGSSTNTPSLTNNFTNGAITFNLNVQNANQNNTWTGAAGSTTVFNNSVYLYTSGLSRSLTLTGGGNFTFNSALLNTAGSGVQTTAATTLFIKNTGTTILQGNNTFRGALNIAAGTGTVQLNGDNTVLGEASAPNKYVITNGRVLLGNSLALGVSTNTITLGSAATAVGDVVSLLTNSAVTIANPITLYTSSNSATATLGGNLDVNSTYSGLITIGKITGATITQVATTNGNAVSFTGGIKASVGITGTPATLVLTGPGDIKFNTGALTDGTGVLAITIGATTLSTPNVTFTGSESAPYTYTGPTKLIGGSLTLSNPYSISVASNLNSGGSASDSGTLILTGGLTNSNLYEMNQLNFGGRLVFSNVGVGSSTLTFKALTGSAQTGSSEKKLVVNTGANIVIAGSFDLVGSTTNTPGRYLRIEGEGNVYFNGVVQNNASGTAASYWGGLNKNSGGGTLTLNGDNTFNGGVIFGAGIINAGSAENAGVSGPLGSSGTLTMNGGYLQYSVKNNWDYSNRFSTGINQKYNVDTNGQTVTWATPLASVGGSLTKAGLGTLVLNNTNTYDGGTTLAGGALQLDSANAIGSTGTISFTGGALKFTSTNTTDYSSRFNTSAGQLYNLDTNGQTITVGTTLTGTGSTLTKSGNGVLSLTAANTYSGDTTINQGELKATTAGNLSPNSSVVVLSGATLNLNSTNQSIKGLANAGTVSLGAATLTINDGDNRTFSGDITGGGSVIKAGSGTQTISSTLSYAGTTDINAGVLKLNGALAGTAVTIASSATLTGKGTITAPITVSANGIITAGDTALADASRGALTVSTLTFSGAAIINLANINLGAASSILNIGALSALGSNGSITININNTTQLKDNDTFTVLKYASLDNFSAFIKGTITGASARQSTTLVNDVANSQIILTTAGDTLTWAGSAPLAQWTTAAGNANWKLLSSGLDSDYLPADIVSFDDTASTYVVTIAEAVLPSSLTFNNSTNYTLNSAASTSFGIEGTTSLI